jgi:SAM-dependent methyltransferase
VHWQDRHDEAGAHVLPFLDRVVGIDGKRVLEFGAGAGPISAALAPRVASVLGLDIAAADVAHGQRVLAEREVDNVELAAGDFETLIERCTEEAGDVDIFLLHAVLEHMTLDERLTVLATAKETLTPGGSLCIFESPNRLLWWDHHTSQLPFFGMLGEPLALAYAAHSEREAFVSEIRDADEGAPLALARFGRGVSQHEFELVFGSVEGKIVAGGYEPEMLPIRHVHREELYLARFLGTLPVPPSPVFSRYWLDLVLKFDAGPIEPLVTPWPFATDQAYGVVFTPWETLRFQAPDAWLEIPSAGASELHLGVEAAPAPLRIRVEPGRAAPHVVDFEPQSDRTRYAVVRLAGTQATTRITASAGTDLSFVGLRGARHAPG